MKKSRQPEQRQRESALGYPLSLEELAQVTGGSTAKMPRRHLGNVTYGDMDITTHL
jgi:hypothetical protein